MWSRSIEENQPVASGSLDHAIESTRRRLVRLGERFVFHTAGKGAEVAVCEKLSLHLPARVLHRKGAANEGGRPADSDVDPTVVTKRENIFRRIGRECRNQREKQKAQQDLQTASLLFSE